MSASTSSRTINRRALFSLAGAAGAAAAGLSPAFAQAQFRGRELVSSSFGGPGMEIMQRVVFDAFGARTGARATQVPLLSAQAFARMRAEKDNPQLDMYMFSGGQEVTAKAEGLTQPIVGASRMSQIPANLRDPDGHWVVWGVIAEGILYRTDKIANPPTSYADFFRPELQGHIAFPHITNGYGMDFLVMLARMNGGGERNIDPGFEAMKRLRGASIFRAPTDVQTLFSQGDIWMLPYDAATAVRSNRMGLPVAFATPREGAPAVFLTACIAKNSRNAEMAAQIIDGLLGAESQIAIAREVVWGPSNPTVQLPADIAATVARPDQLAVLDRDAINAARPQWAERWNREIAGG
ncbi:MAG: extracellular solute-binding protein [Alphaproteobacteria bacterium]|nr:extracellular solute-binding protein [Alphaproteobacteria bacterium]